MRISFGPFAFDRQSRLLWRNGAEIALPPRVLGVLELLLDRAGEVVARQDLLNGVWKDAFVTDTSLAEAVSFLRQALGDDPQAPRYIQTVHRRGYRFLAPVVPHAAATPVAPATPASDVQALDPPAGRPALAWQLLPWMGALLSAGLMAGTIWRTTLEPGLEAPQVARFSVQPAPGTAFDRASPSITVAADGRTIAWVACDDATAACAIYTRAIDRLDSTRLAGTEGASAPFFSADGRWLAFFADGKLKKIAAAGGSPSIIADAPSPGGGTWGADGRIAFAGSPAGGLSIVSDEGGPVTALTMPRIDRGELRHLDPAWLPRGGLLFTIAKSPSPGAPGDLAAMAALSRDWKTLRGGVTRAVPAGAGYVVLSSGTDLQAATFDEPSLSLAGSAESVLASVADGEGLSQFALGGGTLAAVRADPPARVSWADGDEAIAGTLARLSSIAISPDSRRAAGVLADSNGSDVWVVDLSGGTATRITYGGTNVAPVWSSDGTRIFYASRAVAGAFSLLSRDIARREPTAPIAVSGAHVFPSSAGPDGRLAVTVAGSDGRTTIGIVPAGGGQPQLLSDGPFDEASAAFSPDGQWLALESDESGRSEIVARRMTDGRRVAISTDGGTRPRWSADGRAIYFDHGRRLMRVTFDASGAASTDQPAVAFDRTTASVVAVTSSGRMLISARAPAPETGIVVLQWLRELRQRLPLPVTSPR